jgi:hypothetical protein
MIEQNKYYTPSIEEFHVGFEYEEVEIGTKDKFNKTILDSWNGLVGYYDGSTDLYEIARGRKVVRVKYLDQEDIESLGFKLNPYGCQGDNLFFELKNKDFPEKGGYEFIELILKSNNLLMIIDSTGAVRCLDIVIKNKSELKKLMEQLNILV